ncbi:MAG: STAS domain-containing protein [Acidiferrobacterales bacterium]
MVKEILAADIESDNGGFQVKGALTFATVPALIEKIDVNTISAESAVVVDLSGVTHSDSAGLALLLQWLSNARMAGGDLRFINIPDQVKQFININGLAEILVS